MPTARLDEKGEVVIDYDTSQLGIPLVVADGWFRAFFRENLTGILSRDEDSIALKFSEVCLPPRTEKDTINTKHKLFFKAAVTQAWNNAPLKDQPYYCTTDTGLVCMRVLRLMKEI